MATLAAIFRLLYSADSGLERKIEAAEKLVAALLDDAPAASPTAAGDVLPPLVRAHYLRSLLDWSCGALKKPDVPGGGASKRGKQRKQQAAADDDAAQLQPRCWAVLVMVVGSAATPPSQPLPATLLPAATVALQRAAEPGQGRAADALLPLLAALLRLMHSKFGGGLRPGVERAAAALEATLRGREAADSAQRRAAWEAAALEAARLLLAAAAAHPNHRKVWDATVPRLLPLLARAAFSADSPVSDTSAELPACCRQLLQVLVLHPQHVPALAAAAAAEMEAAVTEAAALGGSAQQGTDATQAEPATEEQQQQQRAASYAAQLLSTLREQAGEGQLPLPILPWLAGQFCAALREHRRAAETEAAIVNQAGLRSQQQKGRQAGEEDDGADGAAAAQPQPRAQPAAGGLSLSADFHFWVALLRTVQPHAHRSEEAEGEAAAALSGMALLAGALQQHSLYRPTQDLAGEQRAVLQRLADAALGLARRQSAGGQAASALGVLGGVLAVEHRVIQRQLPLLWPLLLCSRPAAAPGGGAADVAEGVACGLVAAFAELRQLAVLLESLVAALEAQPEGAAAQQAAAAVLGGARFAPALASALRGVPSGQVPVLVRQVAAAVPRLASGAGAGQALALDLLCRCLAGLAVDLTTATAAAAAAQEVVAALAPALLPALEAAAARAAAPGGEARKRGKRSAAQLDALPELLRLYRHALAVHARCAALHPQVVPLAGQQTRGEDGGGYFAALAQLGGGAGAAKAAPQLAALLGSVGDGGSLHAEVLQAAEQRLQVLHRRQQHLTHACAVALLAGPGGDGGPAQAQAQAGLDQRQTAQQSAEQKGAAAELRQLADFMVAAAARDSSGDGASCDALSAASRSLPLLQEWAGEAQSRALLQACLRQAAAAEPGSGAASGQQPQQMRHQCRQLMLGGELLELRTLAALLPAVLAEGLGDALSAAFAGAAPGSAPPKRRKGSDAAASGAGGSGGPLAPLLLQLERVAGGKAPKPRAWAAAVADGCASVAGLAASGQGGSGGKKRQLSASSAPDGAAAASAGLTAVARTMRLLAQLPLAHLPAEAAQRVAAAATAVLLACWQGGLSAAHAAGAPSQQGLLASALAASAACLEVLAAVTRGGSGNGSHLQQLPAVLQASLLAAGCAAAFGGGAGLPLAEVQAAAECSGRAMQAVCWAQLTSGDGSGLQQHAQWLAQLLAASQPEQQWPAAVLAHACLAACVAAVHQTEELASGGQAAADIVCQPGGDSAAIADGAVVGTVAAQLDEAVAAALGPAAAAALGAAEGCGHWEPVLLAASLFDGAGLLLQLRCCDHAAVATLERLRDGSAVGCASGMAAGLQAAAQLLTRSTQLSPALQSALLRYVAAASRITGRMRPAASSAHHASLLALLLHLLAARQPEGPAEAHGIPPSRRTIPFAAAFPAAAAEGCNTGGGAVVPQRVLLLDAVRELVAGSSSQQLLLPLRFAESALPAARGGALALPVCELLLALLEAGSGGNRQQRLLGQHSERLAALLTGFVDGCCYAPDSGQQQHVPSMQQLAGTILAAGEGSGGDAAAVAAPGTPPAAAPAVQPVPAAAEVAALCTALRALESLAARPRLFPLTPAAASSVLSCVASLWTGFAECAPQQAAADAPLPGFPFRLGVSGGAGLFAGSCHLLLAMLRHRQQELRRCLPLVLQAVRALLRFLAAAQLAARLRELPPLVLAPAPRREGPWAVKCAELLAAVMAEVAGLKGTGVGRYCPQLLADYLLLAAAPPSGRSRQLLRFRSPAAALAAAAARPGDGAAGGDGAAAAAAEEGALAGEPLPREVAAALRQGAFALYGACTSAEVQFLYASLGGGGAGGGGAAASWRAALAALKGEWERGGKYTGKV